MSATKEQGGTRKPAHEYVPIALEYLCRNFDTSQRRYGEISGVLHVAMGILVPPKHIADFNAKIDHCKGLISAGAPEALLDLFEEAKVEVKPTESVQQ